MYTFLFCTVYKIGICIQIVIENRQVTLGLAVFQLAQQGYDYLLGAIEPRAGSQVQGLNFFIFFHNTDYFLVCQRLANILRNSGSTAKIMTLNSNVPSTNLDTRV